MVSDKPVSGRIWKGRILSSEFFQQQWDLELKNHGKSPLLSGTNFPASGWQDLEWNAREALHLNALWPRAPRWWRHFFLPQSEINLHLLRALSYLAQAWDHWLQQMDTSGTSYCPPPGNSVLSIVRAKSNLENVARKQNSLAAKPRMFQHFSLRQWRYFQFIDAFFNDLIGLLLQSPNIADGSSGPDQRGESLHQDIAWHTRELSVILGRLPGTPSQKQRLMAPRLEMNHIAASNCLHQCLYLKASLRID